MKGWLTHALVYACVSAALIGVWLLSEGSVGLLRQLLEEGSTRQLGSRFWPVWPMFFWGIGLAIHTVAFVVGIPGAARRALTQPDREALAAAASAPGRHPSADADSAGAGSSDRPTRRWVVVMFTDVVGSTTLNERLGDAIWHPILAAYRDVVRRAMARHGGAEVTTVGDGFLVRFDAPNAAVQCAVDIQRTLEDDRAAGGTSPNVRIGIHAGEAMDDGSDLLGHVVNLASRVSDAAEPDEIIVTEPVADHVEGSYRLEDRGLRPLKGIAQPRHLLAVQWD